MAPHPEEDPSARHVWVLPTGEHGAAVAGVVVSWQHAPLLAAGAPPWMALVAMATSADVLMIGWVASARLVPVRDPTPV